MLLRQRNNWPPDVSALNALNDYMWQRHLVGKSRFNCVLYKTNNKNYEILTIYEYVEKFLNLYGRYVLQYKSSLTMFSL